MLRSRITPCLLVENGRLIKTVRFKDPVYVGDPLNAVRLFNEKRVDELIVLDIAASAAAREPDYDLIEKLASVCRMPLCYGGGIKRPAQVARLVGLGVEKVAISSALVSDRTLLRDAAEAVGAQSLVAVLDVKKGAKGYEVCVRNGQGATGLDPVVFAQQCEREGAGEILINSIDRDGVMTGYDIELVERVRRSIAVPMTALGGAGKIGDIKDLIERFHPIGAAAGSLFVFKGRFKAVLINYPGASDLAYLHSGESG